MQTVQTPEPAALPCPLITRALGAYWCSDNSGHTINADARMAAVFLMLATEIESWAPPEPTAKVSRMAVLEIAARLRTSIPTSLYPIP